jgi:hypothetical protein
MTTQIDNNEILDFVEYVDTFYNPVTGVYPIGGATVEVITKATKAYVGSLNNETTWGGGDSVDRERVRDIIFQLV